MDEKLMTHCDSQELYEEGWCKDVEEVPIPCVAVVTEVALLLEARRLLVEQSRRFKHVLDATVLRHLVKKQICQFLVEANCIILCTTLEHQNPNIRILDALKSVPFSNSLDFRQRLKTGQKCSDLRRFCLWEDTNPGTKKLDRFIYKNYDPFHNQNNQA